MAKLLLFDIDGTMLRVYGAGVRAMLRAAEQVIGERCRDAEINFGGAMDPWVFRLLVDHGRYEFSEETHRTFRGVYGDLLRAELEGEANPCKALPGVLDLLGRVRQHPDVRLGVLTGNYPETGLLKLRAAGIQPEWFEVAVWGDMADSRPGLIPVALAQLPGSGLTAQDVIVIGDTLRDIHCAHENGALCLAVATGGDTKEDLIAGGADAVVDDLTDPRPLFDLLARERRRPTGHAA
ncbi:MAG TPA: HAD hydrolase-like protein [Polyangia bacterium]|jgi:phosphoglycolate phosphatase-like HAD superfamily hydrolase|nr:HAD hydrolase-like protein [Polyangia bacterium]